MAFWRIPIPSRSVPHGRGLCDNRALEGLPQAPSSSLPRVREIRCPGQGSLPSNTSYVPPPAFCSPHFTPFPDPASGRDSGRELRADPALGTCTFPAQEGPEGRRIRDLPPPPPLLREGAATHVRGVGGEMGWLQAVLSWLQALSLSQAETHLLTRCAASTRLPPTTPQAPILTPPIIRGIMALECDERGEHREA